MPKNRVTIVCDFKICSHNKKQVQVPIRRGRKAHVTLTIFYCNGNCISQKPEMLPSLKIWKNLSWSEWGTFCPSQQRTANLSLSLSIRSDQLRSLLCHDTFRNCLFLPDFWFQPEIIFTTNYQLNWEYKSNKNIRAVKCLEILLSEKDHMKHEREWIHMTTVTYILK